jgi:tetratricopeptide (TPR) repeat protein
VLVDETLTIAGIRRLASLEASSAGWREAALRAVATLHLGVPELTEDEHAAQCEEGLPLAAALLDQDLDSDDRAMVADFASAVLLARFTARRDRHDLDEALRIRRAEAARADSAFGCEARINLAAALMISCEHTGAGPHLAEAREALDSALELATTAEQRAVISGALGNVHSQRYDLHQDPEDLDRSVQAYQAAAGSPVPSVAAQAQASLAAALVQRYHAETGREEDLAEAERHIRAALSAAPPRAWRQEVLVRVLRDRYRHGGDEARIEEAWELISALLDGEPEGSPGRPSLVSTASSVAFCRYLAHHQRTVLDEAISLAGQALDGAAFEPDAQDRAVLANELCLLLTERFTLDGVRGDVDRAIDVARAGLVGGLPREMELGLRTNLANALHRRFESYRDPGDLLDGIRLVRWVSRRSRSAAEKTTALHSLALLLGAKAWMSGRQADFDEAIACLDEVIRLSPPSSAERAGSLINQADLVSGRALAARGRPVRDLAVAGPVGDGRVLGQLIGLLEDAWSAAPPDSAVRAQAAYQLGCHYAERSGLYTLTGNAGTPPRRLAEGEAADMSRAIGLWREAIALGEPFVTIEASQQLGTAAFALEQWDTAAAGYRAALGAADALADRRTLAADQQLARFQVQGVAAAAALAALRAGSPRDAVLCLEQGTATVLARAAGHRAESVRFDDIVAAAQRADGPLVYWGATLAGGFALVVRPDGTITATPVALTTAEVEARLATLRAAFGRQSALGAWTSAVRDLLGWTWEAAVRPVAGQLDGFPAAGLIPVGRLASLPLAASGDWPLLARTVPRLFPNGAAIRVAPPWPAAPQVALVCDAGDGPRRLPYADAEADLVAHCHPGARRLTIPRSGEEPVTGRRVLRARGTVLAHGSGASPAGDPEQWLCLVETADLAHVICHYDLDPDQPLRSVLRIGGGVTVADLAERRLSGSPHLVLSACDTGLGGVRLPDEAIGLGMVLLAAGARSVVASLWPLDDEMAAAFMGGYHRRLAAGEEPAAALAATQRAAARDQEIVVWPGLVHVG